MPTQKKIDQVAEIEKRLGKSTIAISAEFRGVTVGQINDLRKQLRAQGIDYMVVKNTLAAIAAEHIGRGGLKQVMKGPSALVFGYGEPTEPAKVLSDFIRTSRASITINGAVMEGQVLNGADVQRFAALPPKKVLMAQLLGSMLAPLQGVVYALNFHMGGLARVLGARQKQLEQAGPQAA